VTKSLDIHVKGTASNSEKVSLATARLRFIFHSEYSIGWKSFQDIELSESVLPDSWIQSIQTNITHWQTAGGEEGTLKNVIHDSERNVACTSECLSRTTHYQRIT
jgi:hypothetical protein